MVPFAKLLSLSVAAAVASAPALAQIAPDKGPWTAEQDHQNMMDQLGIRKLRPGPSGNECRSQSCQYRRAARQPMARLAGPDDACMTAAR